jgi:hypothetical protein
LVSLDKCMEMLYWWFYSCSCCSSLMNWWSIPISKYCAVYSTICWAPWSTAHVCVVLSWAPPLLMMVNCCCIPPCPGLGLDPCLAMAYHLNFPFFLLPSVNDTWYWTYSSFCLCSTGFQDQSSYGDWQDEEWMKILV